MYISYTPVVAVSALAYGPITNTRIDIVNGDNIAQSAFTTKTHLFYFLN